MKCKTCGGSGLCHVRCTKCERQFVHDECDGFDATCLDCDGPSAPRDSEPVPNRPGALAGAKPKEPKE